MSLSNSNRVCLEIPQPLPAITSIHATAGARQRAQMNQQCLAAFLPWLETEFNLVAKVYPNAAALPSIWEVVNGTAITVAQKRLVLIPTVAIAVDEMDVPQEWVDIPTWAADYYVAMQVDPEAQMVQILGYTTHQRLKATGEHGAGRNPAAWTRTYCLDIDDLLHDISSLWLSLPFSPQASLRAAVAPIPPLPQAQADNLLARLGNPTAIFPRLAVPFAQWGALLAHGGWRQRLYERRQGWSDAGTVPQWIQSGLSGFARQCGWERQEFFLAATGVRSLTTGVTRSLVIAGNAYNLRVFPVRRSHPSPEPPPLQTLWRVELRSAMPDRLVPAGFTLRLLTEALESMEHNEDVATTDVEALYIDVALVPGEGLVWEVEPTPEDFEREILRF